MKPLVILGSTGSIGVQTLQVAKEQGIKIKALAAHSNVELLRRQSREFSPERVCVSSEDPDALSEIAALPDCAVVNAVVGFAGLKPTLAAINAGNKVAVANKEALVAGGEIIMSLAKAKGVPIVPIDSEHSAVMQCLAGQDAAAVEKIILTASGGPFRGYTKEKLKKVTREQAMRHPNWNMGAKVTVDSATMMNKGLELIEAVRLFGISEDKVEIAVHPQSVVHSAVEFIDGSVIAQMGVPDMRLPILYALTYPERLPSSVKRLSLIEAGCLTFEGFDGEAFPLPDLARRAVRFGGNAPCILNAANEAVVELFLRDKIKFCEISEIVAETYEKAAKTKTVSLEIIESTQKSIYKKFFD
ncbi:MAG: 1-deoxy-D-xylulose-5-phosphate reductoisomerase [Oscillospiraceae bacterium]|jgi:1-deoxy-D-xylulose-5-phosphate reductoisomerase|nr:1-deoxy-D-xylulose-5-phosphate reductoisomerase [Oscillospiraceae bacterium]